MTAFTSSYGLGRVTASLNDLLFIPRGGAQGRRVVVLLHGYTATARVWIDDPGTPETAKLGRALARRGLLAVAATTGDTWGNTTGQTRALAPHTYAVNNLGAASDKAVIVGLSMGHLSAWAVRRDNPSKVAAIAGITPACDLNDIRDNNRSGSRASIDAAWGVTHPTALPAGADPSDNTATLTGVPYKAYYSTGDDVCLPATVTAFATAVGGSTAVIGSGLHNDALMAGIDVDDLAAFCRANGA
jgi:pimeloyl-ACP methyl ester carboxylesterase